MMGNMSYCRFTNTVADLEDCQEHLDDELHGDEERNRERLVDLCVRIARDYGDE